MSTSSSGGSLAAGAKAHVLYGRMLKETDYLTLLQCKDIPEIAAFLRNTEAYGERMEGLAPFEIRRARVENIVKSTPIRETGLFSHYLIGSEKAFLRWMIERYHVDNLKLILRWIHSGREEFGDQRYRLHEEALGGGLPYDLLLSCHHYSEFLEALRGTRYYRILQEPIERLAQGESNLFAAEMALDIDIATQTFRAMEQLSAADRMSLRPLIGSHADLRNLYWLYRIKRFFHMSPEEALNWLLPVRYRVRLPQLRQLAKASSMEEFWDLLSETPYAKLFGTTPPKEELILEREIKRYIYRQAELAFRVGTLGFPTVVGYLYLREYESEDIVTIMEDVRYDFERRNAFLFLTRPLFSGGEISWQ